MTVVWSRSALRDLNEIAAYIAEKDPDNVDRVIARITASVLRYSDFPGLGCESSLPQTREIVVPGLPYIVHYQVRGDVFAVVRIRHSARHWP
jgi:addiction module RelE/StbE family toxin